MSRTGDPVSGSSARLSLAVPFGAASIACWCCCPFWMLVWFVALPLGLTGLLRGVIEYRAASRRGEARGNPLAGLALSTVGTAAAITYMVFLLTHPELPIQG
ncbi:MULTISPECIES: hypothetical protein [unclassified Streptomyces]|uniref:hypothetical protein n=1 Tax=unclassified Streptomyces TaxID=2593676 RepID=UPI0037F81F04